MATKAVYVLQVNWVWDNSNTEYATITVEEPDAGFEELLDPAVSETRKQMLLSCLQKVVEGIGRSIVSKDTMGRLYRIQEKDGRKWVTRKVEDEKAGVVRLSMRLVPVCDFDDNGQPVPVGEGSTILEGAVTYRRFRGKSKGS